MRTSPYINYPVVRSIMVTTLTCISARHFTPEPTMSRRGMTGRMTVEDVEIFTAILARWDKLLKLGRIGNYLQTLNL